MKRELVLVPFAEVEGDLAPGAPGAPPPPERGPTRGIPALRAALDEIRDRASKDPWPLTWLVRADRAVLETTGDAGFWRSRAAAALDAEREAGSELGWCFRPERFDPGTGSWQPEPDPGGDEALLAGALARLRAHGPVTAVRSSGAYPATRPGWCAGLGLVVDASPVPGAPGWEGAPRVPYRPSPRDPARPSESREGPVLVPGLVEALPPAHRLVRAALAMLSRPALLFSPGRALARAAWQEVPLSAPRRLFERAVCQLLRDLPGPRWVVAAGFRTAALVHEEGPGVVVGNIESVRRLAEEAGARFTVRTLSGLAARV